MASSMRLLPPPSPDYDILDLLSLTLGLTAVTVMVAWSSIRSIRPAEEKYRSLTEARQALIAGHDDNGVLSRFYFFPT